MMHRVLYFFVGTASSLFLPGNAPKEYTAGRRIDIKVSKLTSDSQQVPFDYYYLNFCPLLHPDAQAATMDENIGQLLQGDSIENTAYEVSMQEDASCRILCNRPFTSVDFARFASMIDGQYVINWLVDGLPVAIKAAPFLNPGGERTTEVWETGSPVGFKQANSYYIFNHVSFTIKYHESGYSAGSYSVVGVDVEPKSIASTQDGEVSRPNCEVEKSIEVTRDTSSILFTYDIKWERSDIPWASRWDSYMKVKENRIHWFSIVNSLVVLFLLTGVIALVLVRILHKDISKYNSVVLDEESSALDDAADEVGWKIVHGDVFRKPRHSKLLAVFIGSGIQIFCMVSVCIIFAVFGLLSPANRGSYIQAMLLLFIFMSGIAGYVSARVYKMFKGEDWKTTTLWAGLIFPGVVFSIFFSLNLLLWYRGSSAAVPFSAITVLVILWVGVSVPLVFFGAYRGYARPPIDLPVRVHHIPRQIPRQPWYAKTFFASLFGGILPFGAVSTELMFLLGSIWHHQYYYLFGFLMIVLFILIVTCAEISVAMTYFQLTAEDYRYVCINDPNLSNLGGGGDHSCLQRSLEFTFSHTQYTTSSQSSTSRASSQ